MSGVARTRLGLGLIALGAALGVATSALTGPASYAVSSALDPTFGVGGVATVGVGPDGFYGDDLARLPDGGWVVVGYTLPGGETDAAVVRLRPDGRPDPAFAPRILDAGGVEFARGVTVQPDGKIVLVGYTSASSGGDAAVWRLLPDGRPDPTFGRNGLATLDSGGREEAAEVAVAPDGRIVVVGRTTVGGGSVTVYRLTAGGVPDSSFNGDGAYGYGGSGADEALAVVVQPDGKILVGGYDTEYLVMAVRRFRTDGSPDPGFGVDGVATVPGTFREARSLALQPDGAILVSGTGTTGNQNDGVIARLTPAGVVDPTFGGPSGVRLDAGGNETVLSVAVLPSGAVVGSGYTSAGSDALAMVVGSNGAPDESFGPGGLRRVEGPSEHLRNLAVQPDGSFLGLGNGAGTPVTTLVYRFIGERRAPTPPPTPTCHGRPATIVGTESRDRLVGTTKADVIAGLGDDDTVLGLGGNDLVCAGPGNDLVKGGAGKDQLYGETGKDKLLGGSGRDRLVGGPDRDVVHQRTPGTTGAGS